MRELTSEEAHAAFMKNRRDRVAEIVEPSVAEKERRAQRQRELVAGVDDMCRTKRRFLGVQPLAGEAKASPEVQTHTETETLAGKRPLPEGWRDEHWKTLQSMAEEFAGVEASNKAEAVAALEAYEAGL